MHINYLRISALGMMFFLVVGCAGGAGSSKNAGGGPVPLAALEARAYACKDSDASKFLLTQDVTIDGQLVPKGTYVAGKMKGLLMRNDPETFAQLQWVLPPQFQDMRGRHNIVYAKRFGQSKWVRFDMTGAKPKEEPTPYDEVVRVSYQVRPEDMGWSDKDRWVGVEKAAHRVTVFGTDGKPAFVLDDVNLRNIAFSISLMREEGAMLVCHNTGDRLYAGDGTPISPPLPILWRDSVMTSQSQSMAPVRVADVYGAQTDPKHPRYWLVQDNGRTLPKPDDLIGLQPLTAQFMRWRVWSGWLVWWQTPDGERCARVEIKDATSNLSALIASREQAVFVEWVVSWNEDKWHFEHIRRRAGQTQYEVVRRFNSPTQTFATVDAANAWLDGTRRAEAVAYSKLLAEQNAAKRRWEAEQQAKAAQREAERRAIEAGTTLKAIEAAKVAFDAAYWSGNKAEARTQLIKIPHDPYRWTQYVTKYGLDPMNQNSSGSIGYARASAGGTEAAVLKEALKRSLPPPQPAAATYIKPQSDWDYFWNGPRGGGGSSSSYQGTSAEASYQQFKAGQDASNQRNFDAWMRGAQNWGGPR